ncbi:hypothetical protein SLEP1_g13308 [Rubroshorea leprosula]|uniref:Uncharacterized protein n=1 Tax=Rubroshorea leprosula TaxID=152421 RepID=A0AAV5IL95_9ROSI|nr:hypothetical protein SLEP1_g13308 [Rubroshorea leprosula]
MNKEGQQLGASMDRQCFERIAIATHDDLPSKETQARQHPSLEKPNFQICSVLPPLPPVATGCEFWFFLVLDPWGTLVRGLSLQFYASEEAKSRTGKNEGSDELEASHLVN